MPFRRCKDAPTIGSMRYNCQNHSKLDQAVAIAELGLKNQRILGKCLDYGLLADGCRLRRIDAEFSQLFLQLKEEVLLSNEEQQAAGYTHYIWRTRRDHKVRVSHAANNGKIFWWKNPPEVGHSGEDYNCRCIAEPYVAGQSEYAYQTLSGGIYDQSPQWTNTDFTRHFYFGEGRGVTLSETGHLQGIIDYYFYRSEKEGERVYDRISNQIIRQARNHTNGEFSYYFYDSYEFRPYLYVFGGSVVSGLFVGRVESKNGMMNISGTIEYFYDDVFTDPASIREIYEDGPPKPEDLYWIEKPTEFGGTFFPIKDNWRTQFFAEAKQDAKTSIYR